MAEYQIRDPDGKILRIQGPENATNEQLIAVAAREYQSRKERIAQDRETIAAQDARLADPTAGQGTVDRFLSGAGAGLTNVGRRATALMLPESLTPEWASDEAIEEQTQRDAPLKATTAGMVGSLVGETAATLPLGAVGAGARGAAAANTLGRQALLRAGEGAVQGALAGQLTTGDALTGAALGGAIGGALPLAGAAGRRLMPAAQQSNTLGQGASRGPTSGQQRSLDFAKRVGLQTTPAMRTGSRTGTQIEAALESSPMTSGAINKIKDANQAKANEIVGQALGIKDAKALDAETLGKVMDDLETTFNSAADKTPRWATDAATTRVQRAKDLIDEVGDEVQDDLFTVSGKTLRQLTPVADRFEKAAAMGTLTGEALTKWSSSLRKAGEQFQRNGDTVQADALFALREKLDDVLLEGKDAAAAERLSDARRRYRLLKRVIEQPGVVNTASGDVSVKSLGNALARGDRKGYMYGRNDSDLYELARFGKAWPSIADSGTGTRTSLNNLLDLSSRAAGRLAGEGYLRGGEVAIRAANQAGRTGQQGQRMLSRALQAADKRGRSKVAPVVAATTDDDEDY